MSNLLPEKSRKDKCIIVYWKNDVFDVCISLYNLFFRKRFLETNKMICYGAVLFTIIHTLIHTPNTFWQLNNRYDDKKPECRTYLASKNTPTQNHFTSQTVKIPHRNKPVFMSIYIIRGASNRCAWRCVNTPIWPHFPAPTSLLLSNKKRLFLEQPGKTLPG